MGTSSLIELARRMHRHKRWTRRRLILLDRLDRNMCSQTARSG
jgi:hypothetical protein